ncbi:hypothetical protein H0274_03635 [Altererythrobacter sp. CC-YST694]|uniref:hypothetical protein n=1 Tax=Altererythrobacter sp. CC-YST694 TaxID=2755038 RepID=UPI001D00C97C|nr:hypothetical protein [Altererythrobacter sp. CC-YST694]MCB5424340.1 hypothetical protein [Altererythrobacter sp. CC-YST694]
MKHVALLLSVITLGGCIPAQDAPVTSAAPALPSGSQVALGQPVMVGKLTVTPMEVAEDSRCPMNARCVWAGRVILVTRIEGEGWRETSPLTLGEPFATHGTPLSLTSVSPERVTGQEPVPAEYRFGFEGGN